VAIPKTIKIKNNKLPDSPGVYLMKNKAGEVIYVGKATSLKNRVSSYFNKAHDNRIAKLVSEIFQIDYKPTDSVLEALILEAEYIKTIQPKYNIKAKDDRSWIYLTINKDEYPKIELIRGLELKTINSKQFKYIFGPYQSKKILESILDIIRRVIPFSTCRPNQGKPCFYRHLKRCPGVCTGEITSSEYKKIIKHISLLFQGKKNELLKSIKKSMVESAKNLDYEKATIFRNQIKNLLRIKDVSLLQKENYFSQKNKEEFFRIEGYDISNISGTSAVGSLVVAENGELNKSQYRKFRIKSIHQISDTGMLQEVLERRFKNSWPYPDLIMIDGGLGQVNIATRVLQKFNLEIPIIGIAKGADRKNNRFVFNKDSFKIKDKIAKSKILLIKLRDEAHRFAIEFHRNIRSRQFKK